MIMNGMEQGPSLYRCLLSVEEGLFGDGANRLLGNELHYLAKWQKVPQGKNEDNCPRRNLKLEA